MMSHQYSLTLKRVRLGIACLKDGGTLVRIQKERKSRCYCT